MTRHPDPGGERSMANRARDWFAQGEKDLEVARLAQAHGNHDWACFASQQASVKVVKALHLFHGQEAWGHVVARHSSTTASSRVARRSTMPVRSLHSSVLRWPDRDTVDRAVRGWAAEQASVHPGLIRLGYFGSYATDSWGVGSDVALVAVVSATEVPFIERARRWDVTGLPVPAEIMVYTEAEWSKIVDHGDRFAGVMSTEVVWVLRR